MRKKVKTKTFSIILPKRWVNLIDSIAEKECMSRTALIKSWLKEYFSGINK